MNFPDSGFMKRPTYGLGAGVVEHVRGNVNGLALDLVGPATVVADALDDGAEVALGHGDGLAIVEGLDGGEKVEVLLDNVAELEEKLGTVVRRDLLGPVAFKGGAGGGDSDVYILVGGLADGGDDILGGGVNGVKLLLLDTLDKLIVDEADGEKISVNIPLRDTTTWLWPPVRII